jgi:hypothetical protein
VDELPHRTACRPSFADLDAIRARIPAGGVSVRELVRQLDILPANYADFEQLVSEIATRDEKTGVSVPQNESRILVGR